MQTKGSPRSKEWRDGALHRTLAMKAGKEARRVLGLFEREQREDSRPREAIDAVLAWAAGKKTLDMKSVRKLSLAAHAAARASRSVSAIAAARAAGQAVATWHAPAHSLAAFSYAQKAVAAGEKEKNARRGRKYTVDELRDARRAVTSLIGKLEKVRRRLRRGSAQRSLAVNRLNALRISSSLIGKALAER